MKTQIIRLEDFDDLTSVRDKMAWGQTKRILLVYPDSDERLLNRRVDLVLLRRRAQEFGARLALVADDPEIRFHADELDIRVFDTIERAQTERWSRTKRHPNFAPAFKKVTSSTRNTPPNLNMLREKRRAARTSWQDHLAVQIISALVGVLAVLAIVAVVFPQARVHLTPSQTTQTITFSALTSPSITTVTASGAIPTNNIEIIVEGRSETSSTGRRNIPGNPAIGDVTFTNLTDRAVIVPQGTIVTTLTDPLVKFTTTDEVQIGAGVGLSETVAIRAVLAGRAGNVARGGIGAVEGPLGLQLSVINSRRTRQGTDLTVSAPTEADRERVYTQLLEELTVSAAEQLRDALAPGDILLSPTPTLVDTLEASYTPATLSQPADVVGVVLRLSFAGQIIRAEDLSTLTTAALQASLPKGYIPAPDTIRYTVLTAPEPNATGTARWEMTASQEITAEIDELTVRQQIIGQAPATARQRVSASQNLAITPEIDIAPSWWGRLPFLGFRIEIVTDA